MTTQINNWEETWKDFNEAVERNKDIPAGVWMQIWLQKQITLAKAEERKRIVGIIKTPMSTEFEDPEEESADYSIEDFRTRLLKQIID